jgi:3-phosphoshikimate 1-carboxyvinyltransferase
MNQPPSTPDRVRILPSRLGGSVLVPGDKSLSPRCLMIGALAEGPVLVSGLAPSADVMATAQALRRLGVRVDLEVDEDERIIGVVQGPLGEQVPTGEITLDCGNSGTSMRLLAGLAAGFGYAVRLVGDASLSRRPMERIVRPLRAMGATVEAEGEGQRPPLVVRAGTVVGIDWESEVASAQIKSAVLLAAMGAEGRTTVRSPAPSRDHTERMLAYGGVDVVWTIDRDGVELVNLKPSRPQFTEVYAPRDPSAAAFWNVAAAIGARRIDTPALCLNEGRTGALEVLQDMGADVRISARRDAGGEPVGDVRVEPSELGGTLVEGELVVRALDELPILALAGALSEDGIEVRDAGELRVKESDRIATLAALFADLGMRFEEHADGFRVPGGQRPAGGIVDAHGDHRIAMTAAIAGTVASGPVEIVGFGAVATSYPDFLRDLERLGGKVERSDD